MAVVGAVIVAGQTAPADQKEPGSGASAAAGKQLGDSWGLRLQAEPVLFEEAFGPAAEPAWAEEGRQPGQRRLPAGEASQAVQRSEVAPPEEVGRVGQRLSAVVWLAGPQLEAAVGGQY